MSLPVPNWLAPDIQARMVEFDRWDRTTRAALGPFAGLAVRSNRGGLNLSRHWPHLLCWQWILRYEWPWCRYGRFGFYRSGPGRAGGMMLAIRLPILGALVYQRQASDRIASYRRSYVGGLYRQAAPVIFPKNHEAANETPWPPQH